MSEKKAKQKAKQKPKEKLLVWKDDERLDTTYNGNLIRVIKTDDETFQLGVMERLVKGQPEGESGAAAILTLPKLVLWSWIDDLTSWFYQAATVHTQRKTIDPILIEEYTSTEDFWNVHIEHIRHGQMESDSFGNKHYKFDFVTGCVRVTNMSTGSTRLFPREKIVRVYITTWHLPVSSEELPKRTLMLPAAKKVWKNLLQKWGLSKAQATEAFGAMRTAIQQYYVVLPRDRPIDPLSVLIAICGALDDTNIPDPMTWRFLETALGMGMAKPDYAIDENLDVSALSVEEAKSRTDQNVMTLKTIDAAIEMLTTIRDKVAKQGIKLWKRWVEE
jgi:hypothetical protein